MSQVDGVVSIHDLHIWQMNQQKTIASAHVVVSAESVAGNQHILKTMKECFHEYGIHHSCIQPEIRWTQCRSLQVPKPDIPPGKIDAVGEDNEAKLGSCCQLNCCDQSFSIGGTA